MQKISVSERIFLERGVDHNVRADGRTRMDYRHFTLETGIISQTNGSSRLRLSNTDVLVGVKAEIGEPSAEHPDQGRFLFSVECCPSASPEFEGRGGEYLNIELARVLERTLNSATSFDLKSLCIVPGKQCWLLYIDVMVLDSGGNLFDSISMATRAALYNTRIPSIKVVQSEGDTEIEMSDDPDSFSKLDISGSPICVTLTKIGKQYVVDTSLVEELSMNARLTVGVTRSGKLCSIQKGGPGGINPVELSQMLKASVQIGSSLIQRLDVALVHEDTLPKVGFFA